MPIELGLSRILALLRQLGNPQKTYKSVHVAGTNGKGSTVAYLSSILTASKIRNGRFTSPHMVYYNDCICINNEVYPFPKFEQVKALVDKTNDDLKLRCTEFELLTATAFKIFELEKVDISVIEVGLGGRLDATNVLEANTNVSPGVIVSAITKIAFDHEGLLGNTIEKIAKQKAGIIKQNIPCVVDASNKPEVLNVVRLKAEEMHSAVTEAKGDKDAAKLINASPLNGAYQLCNLNVALRVIDAVQKHFDIQQDWIHKGIENTKWQGRLQKVEFPGKDLTVLLDGSHNENAAKELGAYLKSSTDRQNGIVFIVGFTKGKLIGKILRHTLNNADTVYPTTFSKPEGMPWITPAGSEEITNAAKNFTDDVKPFDTLQNCIDNVAKSFKKGDRRPVVIFGSLYLVSDALRLIDG